MMFEPLLKELVKIDSSRRKGANQAVEFCAEWLQEQGLSVKILENNGCLMLVSEIGSGNKTIILNGHVDVVSGTPDQFFPEVIEGKLYGRGSADMKAGVAALMCTMAKLKDLDLHANIQLQIVSDEETGGFNCSGYLAEQGYLGDFVICAEPTQLGIGLQAKGVLQLDLEIDGSPAHGSRPWEGINAIEKAYEIYQAILHLPFTKESTSLYAGPSVNLAKIKAGDAYNKVPDKCMISLDIRYLPGQSAEDIISEIKAVIGNQPLHLHMASQPVQTKETDPFITMLRSAMKKKTQKKAAIFGQHGSADTVYFAKHGISAIEFGPSGGNWHGNREYADLESCAQYIDILSAFLSDFTPDS
ncbi:M20 family metallopeptidase [Bacillus massiliglaciei]|uniref:M20 family metallopeptidase n=1 Tax=Bacillus massiliglaciei TaxID=1816693 RepID=UPI000A9CA6E8|nr:M20/M25/M40 family metallo-hydrolase [Bacillus massiliglaciei]